MHQEPENPNPISNTTKTLSLINNYIAFPVTLMDSNSKSTRLITPKKCSKNSENLNPNVENSPVFSKSCKSPLISKSVTKSQKSVSRNPNTNPNQLASPSPKNKIRQRKFVIAKKKKTNGDNLNPSMVCKCNNKAGVEKKKCLCVAYETLRASQEEFFKNRCGNDLDENELEKLDRDESLIPDVDMSKQDVGSGEKRGRERLLEEVGQSVPENSAGKVKHLVKAFEKLLSLPKTDECEEKVEKDEKEEEDCRKGQKWALPGLQTQVSAVSSFCPSDFFLTTESLGLDPRRASSLDSSNGCFSNSSRTSGDGRRSRRDSSESAGTFARRNWKRRQQLKATSQKPFKLRTEERGKGKEEEFFKKVQQMAEEEEKQRIPIAQGLPWTTDEPESLSKPLVKEITRPVDLVLHSDIRAVERSEFDHQVAEKLSYIEQYKMERERLQKMAEEEEIRRLRKELVPKAQPMPYFDRPFIPRRSAKNPTMPRDPKFHIPQHKKIKCCISLNDMYIHNENEWGCSDEL
ncbi:microtubule-destabilizing protein 60-like isoform X1 [Lycium barbarum]|uniref:microtubule-destabilizing protein 60-like isoform X1 n=1 Tax=Lycium barbarum TaxID=112863 RepID=UPI00293EB785|nr:microtubule-destabilizing protein 60-like isoform X1 [Lycium barbarum]